MPERPAGVQASAADGTVMRPQRFDIPMGCPAGWFLALVACLFMLQTESGWAHRSSAGTDTSGISIPSLSHGEMAVIADYRK
ncbi:hypothetical protein LXJ58_36530, partial [Escherichia coli]|nr:hypothetical protein [Escherichia coli]